MPASACAALPSTCREIRFSPATSVTEYSIAMSDAPTYGATSPEATVDTMTLATPTGSARIAGVINAVPPEPPSPSTPPTSSRAAQEPLQRHRHRRDRRAPVTGEHRGRAVRVRGRDLGRRHVGAPPALAATGRDVHRDHIGPAARTSCAT